MCLEMMKIFAHLLKKKQHQNGLWSSSGLSKKKGDGPQHSID